MLMIVLVSHIYGCIDEDAFNFNENANSMMVLY